MIRYAHLYSRSNASTLHRAQGSASETTPLLRSAGKGPPTKGPTALYPRAGALARLPLPRAALARLFAKAVPSAAQRALHSGIGSVVRIGDDRLPLPRERGSAAPPPPVRPGARGSVQQFAADRRLRAELLAARQAALAGLAGTLSAPDLAVPPAAASPGHTAVPGGQARLSGGQGSLLLSACGASQPDSSVCLTSHPLSSTRRASSPGGGMLDAYRLIAAMFPRASDAQLERLQCTLHGLELPAQADRSVLAYALAAATDGDIALTQRVLHGLKDGLDLGAPTGQHARRPTLVERSAWRAAALLSRNEDGFELLRALHPTHSSFGRAARVLLQTAPCEDRATLKVRLGPQMPSLQERAHAAAVALLTPERVLSDTQKAAFFAWEQGFREDGEGSPLHRVQQHLCKFAHKTIPRAQKSRLRSFLPRLFGSRKSPLSALRHGLHGADRTSLETERAAMDAAAAAAAARLQEVLAPHAAEILDCARPLEALVALAMLQHRASTACGKRGDQVGHRGSGGAPSPVDVASAMRDILQRINPDTASANPSGAKAQAVHRALVQATRSLARDPVSFLKTQPALRRQLARAITPSRLSAWGKLRALAASDPFWQHLDAARLVGGSAGLGRARRGPGTRKRHAVQQDLRDLIDGMGSSARLRLADGSRRGLGTKGLSMNLSTLLHLSGIPLGPRLNLGRRTSRRAVVEIGRASHGGEILIGTERLRRRVRGVGVMLGYDCHVGPAQVRCGISVDLDRSREKADVDAVLLRMAQRRCADGSVDELRLKLGMRKIVDFLFSESRTPEGPQAQASQLFERFAVRFFDDPDLSIGLSNPSARSSTTSMSAVASAMATVGGTPLRLGPAVGLSGSRKSSVQHDAGGQGGRLRGVAASLGQSRKLAIGAGFKGKLGLHAPEEASSAPVTFGLLDASLPSWNMTLRVNGQSAKARLMREQGRLVSENCFLDVEFDDAGAYVAAVNAERSAWLASLSRRDAKDPDAPARARAALDAHLADVRCYARRNQRHVLRARLRPDVARAIDAHGTACALIRASSHLSESTRERLCVAREAACATLVAAPTAWMPAELKTLEQSATHVRLGLQLGLQLSTETSAEGEHQLASLKTGAS